LITSGKGGSLAYYRNTTAFTRVDLHLPPARYDETTVLPLPAGQGRGVLLLGQSNYESQTPKVPPPSPASLEVTRAGPS